LCVHWRTSRPLRPTSCLRLSTFLLAWRAARPPGRVATLHILAGSRLTRARESCARHSTCMSTRTLCLVPLHAAAPCRRASCRDLARPRLHLQQSGAFTACRASPACAVVCVPSRCCAPSAGTPYHYGCARLSLPAVCAREIDPATQVPGVAALSVPTSAITKSLATATRRALGEVRHGTPMGGTRGTLCVGRSVTVAGCLDGLRRCSLAGVHVRASRHPEGCRIARLQ